LRERGELLLARATRDRRSLRFDRRWGRPVETDPAALVESLTWRIGVAAVGSAVGVGRPEIAGSADARRTFIPATEAVIRLNTPRIAVLRLGVGVMTALVFGPGAGVEGRRARISTIRCENSGKGISGGFRHGKLRNAVVVLEVGLSLMLLVTAGLLMRSFVALPGRKAGFATGPCFLWRGCHCQWNG